MWRNLSYPSKTTLALSQRIAAYTGMEAIEPIHIALGALAVSANALHVALLSTSRDRIASVGSDYLTSRRAPSYQTQARLTDASKRAIDAAHAAKRKSRIGSLILKPASYRTISTDQLVVGCIRTDETSCSLLTKMGITESAYLPALATQPPESRWLEAPLSGLFEFEPIEWLTMTDDQA